MAASIVGTYLINKSKRDRIAQQIAEKERLLLIESMKRACSQLQNRALKLGSEIAERETHLLEKSIKSTALFNQKQEQNALLTAKRLLESSKGEQGLELDKLNTKQNHLRSLQDKFKSYVKEIECC